MSREIQIFRNEEFGTIRTIVLHDEPWFVTADVCRALEIRNPSQALTRLDEDEKTTALISNESAATGKSQMSFVNEPGLYSLVLGSRKPEARVFKRWVTHEVIPAIRKTGGYVANDELFIETYLPDADETIKALFRTNLMAMREQTKIIREQGERIDELEGTVENQRQTIEDYKPKVDYLDTILSCKDAVTTTQIAADYDISANRLNKILCEAGLQRKVGGQWILYRRHMGKGYTKSETIQITHKDGTAGVVMQTKWTQKGRVAIYEILKSRGIEPVMDQTA